MPADSCAAAADAGFAAMFLATTLAISLALSPVTALVPGGLVPLALAPAAGTAAAGTAGDDCKLDFRTALQIDTTALGDDAQGVSTRLRSKTEQELQRSDIMVGTGDPKKLPQLVVKVVSLPGEDEGFSYTIDINHADQVPIRDGSSVGECRLCTESELLEKIVGATRALMPKLRAYITDYNNKGCAPPPPECSTNADCRDPAEPVCDPDTRACVARECNVDADCVGNSHGPACHPVIKQCVPQKDVPATTTTPPAGGLNGKQKAGIGLMAAGAVGLGIGIGLVVRKPTAPDPYMAWQTRETQVPGYAILAVGGAALITGLAVFLVGRRQQPKSQVAPLTGAGVYGLSWSGRF